MKFDTWTSILALFAFVLGKNLVVLEGGEGVKKSYFENPEICGCLLKEDDYAHGVNEP